MEQMLYIWLNVEGKLEKEMSTISVNFLVIDLRCCYTIQHVSQRTCLSILLRLMLQNKLHSVKADFQSFHEAPHSLAL